MTLESPKSRFRTFARPACLSVLFVAALGCAQHAKHAARTYQSARDLLVNAIAERRLAKLVQHTTEIKRVQHIIDRFGPKKSPTPKLAALIVKESRNAGFDPLFVAAVVKSESTFRPAVTSCKNARGLMQITPITEREVKPKVDLTEIRARNLDDPEYNLRLGIHYLKQLERRYKGDRALALVAYNWGPGHVQKALRGEKQIPDESLRYARKILANHELWAAQG